MRLKLTLEYDGTEFHGWAAQPRLRTVEGVLHGALGSVFRTVDSLAVAGRTDAGVHALGNVVSVDAEGGPPVERAAEAINASLPDDVSVIAAAESASDFHARHSARARSYRQRAARRIDRGQHDFRAFTPTETQHDVFVRNVSGAEWHRRGEALEFEITADSFLRHMVRTLVGTMLELPPERIEPLLDGRMRAEAGSTAPAWGLYLERVDY